MNAEALNVNLIQGLVLLVLIRIYRVVYRDLVGLRVWNLMHLTNFEVSHGKSPNRPGSNQPQEYKSLALNSLVPAPTSLGLRVQG